jgi:hypothetical protein
LVDFFFHKIHFFERWQRTALLVFFALDYVLAKTKCAVCAAGILVQNVEFQHDFRIMHNVIVYD